MELRLTDTNGLEVVPLQVGEIHIRSDSTMSGYWEDPENTAKAFVELRPGARASAEDLGDFARERLAAYKVPDRWTFLDRLPRSPIGKIEGARLHALAAGGEA